MSDNNSQTTRRGFLYGAATSAAALRQDSAKASESSVANLTQIQNPNADGTGAVAYPRVFTGKHLAMIAFPLGGVGAGSVSLGGRGQLRDWEIFNKADKGRSLDYAMPSIWVQSGSAKPIARVLEARYLPPYEGQNGLGSRNAPGLSRLSSAKFIGEYPLARIEFEDETLPVRVALDAFSPFIPHEADDSGLPIAILRYSVTNPGQDAARVSIAWSAENPIAPTSAARHLQVKDTRLNEFRHGNNISGLFMRNTGTPPTDPLFGSMALALTEIADGKVTHLRGWPRGRWWNSPMLFWDDFSADGALGPEPADASAVGALCLSREIPARTTAAYTFILGWHFPNRTPARCGWQAPKGDENTIIGNWYSTRFSDAWNAVEYTVQNLSRLEKKTRLFAASLRESTLPAAIKEAASANLSTLATTTCFRTADGEFHGFEGVNDKSGCCFGNCTHVWNYETATAHLFPSLSRSLRKAAFGYSLDDAGAIHFRQLLPDGKERSGFAAADGQMGQILHAYMDWNLSGDKAWLLSIWPRVKKAMEFAWIKGGWDADRDGVMEGVQHNTYDVEFYGPNPQCGIYYLGALRACEEMARTMGENEFARQCRSIFESGKRWIDANLFNGEFYVQNIVGRKKDQIAPSLLSAMGSDNTEQPEYQVGKGCLVDQLVGQYLAEVCGLGPLLDETHIHKTLDSIYRYNHKPSLYTHDSVQRTYALNDESALVICDYGKAPRPHIPFPYYAEVMTGFEYCAATHMLYAGMTERGVECVTNIRNRYDGERRNPWDEAECGHHYARAMASWSGVLALSGFRYDGNAKHVSILPPGQKKQFRCFWSTGTGWGVFEGHTGSGKAEWTVHVHSGALPLRICTLSGEAKTGKVLSNEAAISHRLEQKDGKAAFHLTAPLTIQEGRSITFSF